MNYSKETIKKVLIVSITVIVVITTIICAIYFRNKTKKETQTFLPVEDYSNSENEENIERLVAILSSLDEVEENTTNEVDNNVSSTDTNTTTSDTTENTSNYYIKVNYDANVVTIYTKDSSGNYTIPLKAMICSTGDDTPRSGVYKMDYKYRWLSLFGDVYGQYCTRIVGNILFHSVPYLEKGNPASLEYWEYDKLGTSASMGCIRLKVEDAMWIYNNCPSGTMVEFYSSSNPGPLGKPTAPKISGYASPYRNWDPTDTDSSNPWKTNPPTSNETSNTTKPENKVENNTSNNVTNNTVNNTINNTTNGNNTTVNNTGNTIDNIIDNDVVSNNTTSASNNTTSNNSIVNGIVSNNTIESQTQD